MECNAVNCVYYQKGSCGRDAVSLMEIAEELVPAGSAEKRLTLRDQKGCYSGAVNVSGHCPDFRSH
mgnify:CR=1 FL=1